MRIPLLLSCALLVSAALPAQSGAQLARLDGAGTYRGLGGTIAPLGDINGDGVPDFVVGGDQYISYGSADAVVYSGSDFSVIHRWSGLTNAEAVAAAGDVDGVTDVIVGSIWTNSKRGQAKVYSGASGALLHTFDGLSPDDYLGNAVSGAGDVDGDGFDDLLVGAWGRSAVLGFSGVAYLYSGFDGSLIRELQGTIDHGYFGHAVAGLGDVDGDGVPDQLIGELGNDTYGYNTGAAHLYSGASGARIRSWTGPHGNARFGEHLANVGDVDGDGKDDCIVAAMFQQPTGTAHVLSCATGSTLYKLTGYDLDEVCAQSVGAAGDTDGDGVPDLVVGSDRYYSSGGYTGIARVFSGATGYELQRFQPASPTGRLGLAVSGIGDLDGDGLADFAAGAPAEDFNGRDSGSVYVIGGAMQGLHFAVADLAPGGTARLRVRGGTPGGSAYLAYGLNGGGPTSTPYGDVAISPPIQVLGTLLLDAAGAGELQQAVPAGSTGVTVWSQALDLASGALSNPHPMTIP